MVQADVAKYEKEFLAIFHDVNTRMVRIKWKGYATSEQLREGLLKVLDIIISERSLLLMADLKHMQSISPADEEWIIKEWFPKVVLTGIKRLGIVTSLDYFNNNSVNRIMRSIQPMVTFETEYFVDSSDAMRWLLDGEE